MEVVYDDESMREYMEAAVGVTPDRPILIDRFLSHALECEAEAIPRMGSTSGNILKGNTASFTP